MAKRKQATQQDTVSEQLRQFIRDCGIPRNQLCKMAGLDPSHLHRFYHGSGALTNHTIDRLAQALRLRLVRDENDGE